MWTKGAGGRFTGSTGGRGGSGGSGSGRAASGGTSRAAKIAALKARVKAANEALEKSRASQAKAPASPKVARLKAAVAKKAAAESTKAPSKPKSQAAAKTAKPKASADKKTARLKAAVAKKQAKDDAKKAKAEEKAKAKESAKAAKLKEAAAKKKARESAKVAKAAEPKAAKKKPTQDSQSAKAAEAHKQRRTEEAEAAKAPQSPMRRRAQELADAMDSGDHAKARLIIREQIEHAIPGATTRDAARPGGKDIFVEEISAKGVGGVHDWDGAVTVTPRVWESARTSVGQLARGELDSTRPDLAHLTQTEKIALVEGRKHPASALTGLSHLVHEEIHGHSRLGPGANKGPGLVLEEVGTELNARFVVSKMSRFGEHQQADLGKGMAYAEYITKTSGIVERHLGVSPSEARHKLREAHGEMLKGGSQIESSREYVREFTSGFKGVTGSQRAAIEADFMRLADDLGRTVDTKSSYDPD